MFWACTDVCSVGTGNHVIHEADKDVVGLHRPIKVM